jgi:hypothetical protein
MRIGKFWVEVPSSLFSQCKAIVIHVKKYWFSEYAYKYVLKITDILQERKKDHL